MPTPHEEALSNLLWATTPMRSVLKGDARAAFIEAWRAGTDALCHGSFDPTEPAPKSARAAAIDIHKRALDVCAALGVRPRELVDQFHDKANGGFTSQRQPIDALTLLGRACMRAAVLEFPPISTD
ncbi:hypothetical protein QMT40_003006 [Parvibaculaceae bacterium PLY_AMNH_Bact1]|nr:hypothetical protein QMT40_003006 [Parvibaculaceae bacterium PLY_AMNH_Bact1]